MKGLIKYQFINVKIEIGRFASWLITSFVYAFVSLSILWVYQTYVYNGINALFWMLLLLVLIFAMSSFQWAKEKIYASIRHTFIKGYYDPEAIFNTLSKKINKEESREKLFATLEKTLDYFINFEYTGLVVAKRNQEGLVERYEMSLKFPSGKIARHTISSSDLLIRRLLSHHGIQFLSAFPDPVKNEFQTFRFPKEAILIPFQSPEYLEGILLLSERSSGVKFSQSDFDFFEAIMNLVSARLYFLTPYEKLEEIAKSQLELQGVLKTVVTLSHEINSPLTSLSMGLTVLEKTTQNLKSLEPIFVSMNQALDKISKTITQLKTLKNVPETDYIKDIKMISLENSD